MFCFACRSLHTSYLVQVKSASDVRRNKHCGEGQLGPHMILALALNEAPRTILSFLASPAEVSLPPSVFLFPSLSLSTILPTPYAECRVTKWS